MDYRVFEITEPAPPGQIFLTLLCKKMIAVMLSFREGLVNGEKPRCHYIWYVLVTRYWTSFYHGICNSLTQMREFCHLASVVQVTVIPSYSI